MTGKQILALAKAGYTLEQIVAIDDALGLPGEAEQDPGPDPQPDPGPDPKNDPQPSGSDATAALAAATAALTSTLEKIQKSNIGNFKQPASEVESTDDILAKMIRGPEKPGKDGQ